MSEMCLCRCEECGESWEESRNSIESDILKCEECGSTDIDIEVIAMKLPENVEELFDAIIGKTMLDEKAIGIIPAEIIEAEMKGAKLMFTIGFNCESDDEAVEKCEKLIMDDIIHDKFISANVMTGYNVKKLVKDMSPEEFEKEFREAMDGF